MNERTKKSWEGKEDHDTSQKLNIYSMYTPKEYVNYIGYKVSRAKRSQLMTQTQINE